MLDKAMIKIAAPAPKRGPKDKQQADPKNIILDVRRALFGNAEVERRRRKQKELKRKEMDLNATSANTMIVKIEQLTTLLVANGANNNIPSLIWDIYKELDNYDRMPFSEKERIKEILADIAANISNAAVDLHDIKLHIKARHER